MAATFDPSLATNRDKVRFLIGDMDVTRAEIQDETIDALLTTMTPEAAAAASAWSIAGAYASKADVNVDNQLTKYSAVHLHWVTLAKQLDLRATSSAFGRVPANKQFSQVMVTGLDDVRPPYDATRNY